MAQDTNDEYLELKKFLSFFSDRYFDVRGLPAEKRPMANLETLEKQSPKAALKGVRQAIHDCIEMSFHFDVNDVKELDKELLARCIITLSELRRMYSKKYKAVVKRGRINSDTEYHLIRNVLNDPTEKSAGELAALENLIANYEAV